MSTTHRVVSIFPIAMMILGTGVVTGQDYPTRTVRIITVPSGAGTDFVTRLLAQGISGPLGQPVIVDNRATSGIAIETVSKAPPDGYTVLLTGSSIWTGPLLQSKPLWDPVNDFSPITILSRSPNVLIVHPSLPVKSVKDLIALAKARSGELNYAAGSLGGGTHLAGELFKSMAGVNIVGVPYKGSALSLNALMGGEVQLMFASAGSVTPQLKSVRLRALAVTSAEPSAIVPGLPTIAASGLPGYESGFMYGVWVPAKTPAPIIRRLNQEIVRVISTPEVKQKVLESGADPIGNSPEEAAATIKADMARLGKVIREAGIRGE